MDPTAAQQEQNNGKQTGNDTGTINTSTQDNEQEQQTE
jgi:hypothetical protein